MVECSGEPLSPGTLRLDMHIGEMSEPQHALACLPALERGRRRSGRRTKQSTRGNQTSGTSGQN